MTPAQDGTAKFADQAADTTHGELSSLAVGSLSETRDEIHVDQLTSAFGPSNNHAAVSNVTLWKLQLSRMIAQSSNSTCQELSLDFDSYHHLFIVIHLLSNSHLKIHPFDDHEVDLVGIVDMIFTFLSRRVLLALFQSRFPSIKAAWEKLLIGATCCKNNEAFRVLITAGMENDWLHETVRGHEHLYYAIRSNCADLVDSLLARGCRADSSCAPPYGSTLVQRTSAIMAALENSDLDHARLLIQNCHINRQFEFPPWRNTPTNFVIFIVNFDSNKLCHRHCLDYFLEQGADVDYTLDLHDSNVVQWFNTRYYWYLQNARKLMEGWSFSILDYVYYFHRPVFSKLAAFSKSSSFCSRAKALWYLEQGVHVLRECLQGDLAFARPWTEFVGGSGDSDDVPEENKGCLEALLAEQFLLGMYTPDRNVCYETVQDLLEAGADLKALSKMEELASDMLYATALMASGDGPEKEQGLHLLQMLLDHGFQVQADALSKAFDDDAFIVIPGQEDALSNALDHRGFQIQADGLSAAIEAHGLAILELLAGYCTDIKTYGTNTLALAISRDNFEATNLLLDRGVDPGSTFDRRSGVNILMGDTIFAVAALTSSLAMMKYVLQRGSSPRICKHDENPFEVLVKFLCFVETDQDLFAKVQYIVEECVMITDPPCPSAFLLELCLQDNSVPEDRRRAFQYLLNKGAKLRPGSPLAEWIASGGGHHLVREMLDAGADPDAFSFETLPGMDRVIPINFDRRTPLQAASEIGDYDLVCLLLKRGADVNRPALGEYRHTALQAICAWDPMRPEERTRKDKIIELLLAKGADVNASSFFGRTALIYAAQLGDLSTAFILLKHGAKINVISRDPYQWPREIQQTALDVAAQQGRLDMVGLLLNANARSASAYTDGKDYDGAIQHARAKGHFVIAELICEHSNTRKRWDVAHGQMVGTRAPPGQPHSLALRTHLGAVSSPHIEARYMPSQNIQDVPILDQASALCATLDEFMAEGSTSASKAKGKEATDLSGTPVIEEVEDESLPADTEWENPSEERRGGTADMALNTGRASPGPGEWLHQRRDQNWIEDEQQNVDAVVSSSLVTDVFMGFSEFSSP